MPPYLPVCTGWVQGVYRVCTGCIRLWENEREAMRKEASFSPKV